MRLMKRETFLCATALMVVCHPAQGQGKAATLNQKCKVSNSIAFNDGSTLWRCSKSEIVTVDPSMMTAAEIVQQNRRDLYWALQTRVLSDQEMDEVRQQGILLLVEIGVPFTEAEKHKELDDALVAQFKIRAIAESAPCSPKTAVKSPVAGDSN